jgi:hypothetical protein
LTQQILIVKEPKHADRKANAGKAVAFATRVPQIPDGDPALRRRFLVREYRAASVRSPELILTLESLERLATSTTFDPQEHSSNTVPITARPYKL